MKIIKQGSNLPVKTFECECCGCIFKANSSEYIINKNEGNIEFSCPCPNCSLITNKEFVSKNPYEKYVYYYDNYNNKTKREINPQWLIWEKTYGLPLSLCDEE